MRPFEKYVPCVMAFFISFNFVTLWYFYSIISPVLLAKLHLETIEWEKRIFLAYIAASSYHVISKEVENQIFRHKWIFRHTCV